MSRLNSSASSGAMSSSSASRSPSLIACATRLNKILSNRVAQAISEGDLEALDELMAPELADEFKRDVAEIRRAFPDYAGTNVEQIAEGEEVANRFVFLGTHLVHLQRGLCVMGYSSFYETSNICPEIVGKGARKPQSG